jgi:hypothetical protein
MNQKSESTMSTSFIVKRVSLALLLGLLVGVLLSESSFIFLQETARAPKVIELVIPVGTADRVARGEQPPSIPSSMSFVVGDELLVRNEDVVDHQLGPMWIPAGTSASRKLDTAMSSAYECSFQPGNYFGFDVHEPLTWDMRLYGILYAGIPAGILFSLYSVLIPARVKKQNAPA